MRSSSLLRVTAGSRCRSRPCTGQYTKNTSSLNTKNSLYPHRATQHTHHARVYPTYTPRPRCTWNVLPSRAEYAATACDAITNVTKASALDFLVSASRSSESSARGPGTVSAQGGAVSEGRCRRGGVGGAVSEGRCRTKWLKELLEVGLGTRVREIAHKDATGLRCERSLWGRDWCNTSAMPSSVAIVG